MSNDDKKDAMYRSPAVKEAEDRRKTEGERYNGLADPNKWYQGR